MQTKREESRAQIFGDAVVAAVDLGAAVAPNLAVASALATRHLERVLARGANTRLAAALADLARELAPTRSRSVPSRHRAVASASRQLAVAR